MTFLLGLKQEMTLYNTSIKKIISLLLSISMASNFEHFLGV